MSLPNGSVAESGLWHLSWKQTNRNVPWVRISPLPPYKSTLLIVCFYMGGLAEWLRQRFAKPSFRNGCISSNLISSANAPMDKLVKSLLSKGRSLSVRIRVGVPELCECATERLGGGLQIRFMQVRFLSPTPIENKSSVVIVQHFTKKLLTEIAGWGILYA